MKTLSKKLLMLLIVPVLLITACEEDEVIQDPSITFSTSRSSLQAINLDANTGPYINGWAVAPAGLDRVTVTVERTDGVENVLEVTSFDGENSEKGGTAYRFYVLPEYTPDFVGVTATVQDVNGKTASVVWEVSATGGTAGPVMEGFPSATIEANVRPVVNIRPRIIGRISSHWGLASITMTQVYSAGEAEFESVTEFGETSNLFTVDVLPDYDEGYTEGMTGFRLNAVDKRGNESELVIPVNVIDASSAPAINFNGSGIEADLTADPQVLPSVTGTVSSLEGIVSVRTYVVRATGDVEFGSEITSFPDPSNYAFSFDPPYTLGVIGVKVVAIDNAAQTSSKTVAVSVIADDPDLLTYNNVELHGTADRHDAGINTCFSTRDGIAYNLFDGLDPAVSSTIDFIVADSGGDNELDIFSPSFHVDGQWLFNNYYKDEVAGDVLWPETNETKMRQLAPGEIDFETATSLDIAGLALGGDWELRVEPLFPGDIVLFETNQGKKGIIFYEATNDDPGKADIFTFDIKVIR